MFCCRSALSSRSIRRTCADPESFIRGGPLITFLFYLMGIEDPNTAINGVSLADRYDGSTLNTGLVAL